MSLYFVLLNQLGDALITTVNFRLWRWYDDRCQRSRVTAHFLLCPFAP